MQFTIAGIQVGATLDSERNLSHLTQLTQLAAERGADIVCLPQLCNTQWFPASADGEVPDTDYREALKKLRACAKRHEIYLIAPLPERPRKDREQLFNTAFVIGPDGKLVGSYRKRHLPDIEGYREKALFTPGSGPLPIFDLGGLRVGIQICWDNYFPEGARLLAIAGAELIFAPTAAAFDSQERWRGLLCSHALCNNLFVFRLNRVGSEESMDFYGQSFCADPFGELVAEPAGDSEAIVMAIIDTERIAEARDLTGFLVDRRPELYGPLTDPVGADDDVSGPQKAIGGTRANSPTSTASSKKRSSPARCRSVSS